MCGICISPVHERQRRHQDGEPKPGRIDLVSISKQTPFADCSAGPENIECAVDSNCKDSEIYQTRQPGSKFPFSPSIPDASIPIDIINPAVWQKVELLDTSPVEKTTAG